MVAIVKEYWNHKMYQMDFEFKLSTWISYLKDR